MRHMHDAPPQERYTSLAVRMHWAVAVLVFFQLGLGSYMGTSKNCLCHGELWFTASHG